MWVEDHLSIRSLCARSPQQPSQGAENSHTATKKPSGVRELIKSDALHIGLPRSRNLQTGPRKYRLHDIQIPVSCTADRGVRSSLAADCLVAKTV
jgi:hypothetical protein